MEQCLRTFVKCGKLYVLSTESSLWTEAISFVKETTQVIDKLQSGLTHFFRVCTYNTAGVSLPSPVSDPVVVPPDSRQGKCCLKLIIMLLSYTVMYVIHLT